MARTLLIVYDVHQNGNKYTKIYRTSIEDLNTPKINNILNKIYERFFKPKVGTLTSTITATLHTSRMRELKEKYNRYVIRTNRTRTGF